MADAGTPAGEVIADDPQLVRLQVAGARGEESGTGLARIPREVMVRLGVTEGDIIEIVGKRTTAARVMLPYPEDEGLQLIRLDGLQRANAQTGSGEHVELRKPEARPAQRVSRLRSAN